MRILTTLFLITITIIFAAGCRDRAAELGGLLATAQQVVDQETRPKIFASPDGQFELTLDDKWHTNHDVIPNALIQAENKEMQLLITAFRHSKKDLGSSPSLDLYTKSMQLQFMLAVEKYKSDIKDPVPAKLGDHEAREFTATLSNERDTAKNTFVLFKAGNYYYKLAISGTAASHDLNIAKARPLLDTFRETIEKKK